MANVNNAHNVSPAMSANIEATVNTLDVGLARIAKLAINLGIYLSFEHARAFMPLRWLLISFEFHDFVTLTLDDLFEIRYAAVTMLVLPD